MSHPQVGSGPLSWDGVFMEKSWGDGVECGAQVHKQDPDLGARGVSVLEDEVHVSCGLCRRSAVGQRGS